MTSVEGLLPAHHARPSHPIAGLKPGASAHPVATVTVADSAALSPRVVVALIAFNEAGKIGTALDRFRPGDATEVVVVDDASTDATPIDVQTRSATLLRQGSRQGAGAAIRRAVDYAIEKDFDVLVIMAGNDKDRPHEISRLVEPILAGRSDLVQGSRYLSGGRHGKMPYYRIAATRYLHPWLFSLLARRRITDSTNGFRAIRVALLKDSRLHLNQRWLDKYELEPYLFYKAIKLGYRVSEAPVSKIYPERALGYTKMQPLIGWWSILRPIIFLGLGIKK
jgi:dolichol-phosphate mannosyltransferase